MMASSLLQRRVGELVSEDFRRAGVFKHYGIDFCCGGGISLEAACERLNLDANEVGSALLRASDQRSAPGQHRFSQWSPSFLASYIENEHHSFVRENIPIIRAFTQKVARVHGEARPELVQVAALFEQLAHEMEAHMAAEEQVVFPVIRGAAAADGRTLAELVADMEGEHDHAGRIMREIRTLTADFQPPQGACNTYRAAFAKLEEFEGDLHMHVHLENNVLFPKALNGQLPAAA